MLFCNFSKRLTFALLLPPVLEWWTSSLKKLTRICVKVLLYAFCSSRDFWIFTTMMYLPPVNAAINLSWFVTPLNILLSMFMDIITCRSGRGARTGRPTTIITLMSTHAPSWRRSVSCKAVHPMIVFSPKPATYWRRNERRTCYRSSGPALRGCLSSNPTASRAGRRVRRNAPWRRGPYP